MVYKKGQRIIDPKKLATLWLLCLFVLMACHQRRDNNLNDVGFPVLDSINEVKRIIESAQQRTIIEKDYKIRVDYLDFFNTDTTEEGTIRFVPKNATAPIRMVLFVEPNVEGWNVNEAIHHFQDSSTKVLEVGEDHFIISGKLENSPDRSFLEKWYLVDSYGISYMLIYDSKYEDAFGRIADLVINWCLKKEEL